MGNELPQTLMVRENFIAVFDVVTQPEKADSSQYVGFLPLYSSSSMETYEFARGCLPLGTSDEFLLFVEMDNTEKKSNVVGALG